MIGAAVLIAALAASAPGRLEGHVRIVLPDGTEGPVPAVLMLSGCGGVQGLQDRYAETAAEAGWASVIIDSHAARGIDRGGALAFVCAELRLRGQARAADLFEALDQVRADPRIDPERLFLAGWSHGGWTVLDAMAAAEAGEAGADPFAGVRGALLLYPYCGSIIRADAAPIGDPFPVTAVLAGRDVIAPPRDCERLAERRRAEGAEIALIAEPGLTHAFDDQTDRWDPRMRYDAEGEARARALFGALLIEATEGGAERD